METIVQHSCSCGGTALYIGEHGAADLACLVLGDSVLGVLLAVLALAVGPAGFWNVDLMKSKGSVVCPKSVRCACALLFHRTLELPIQSLEQIQCIRHVVGVCSHIYSLSAVIYAAD